MPALVQSANNRIRSYGFLTALLLVLMGWSVYPPEQSLRLGKDLSGGVSLIYTVQVSPGEDSKAVLAQTIDVLKRRVDPQGLSEISMVAQGRDRIEITMPLPNDQVKAKKAALDAHLQALSKSAIRSADIDAVLRLTPEQREGKIRELVGQSEQRAGLLREAVSASDTAAAARKDYDDAMAAGVTGAELDALVEAAARAEVRADETRAKVLASTLSGEEVLRVLRLPSAARSLFDNETKQSVEIPSPRAQGLERLRTSRPEFASQIEEAERLYADYASSRRALDDPADLQRLLRSAGVLSFRIMVKPGALAPDEEQRLRDELRQRGPNSVRATDTRWFKINDISTWYSSVQELAGLNASPQAYFQSRGFVGEVFDGEYYLLAWDTRSTRLTQAEGNWGVEGASQGVDSIGRPAINFTMNTAGAVRLGGLTKNHIGDQMAVLLDDQIYTAPTLQGAISKNGQISGDFSTEERQYIIRVLSAGALQAKLSPEPISISVLGPELGKDNLDRGMYAGVISLIAVSIFIVFYYFRCGVIAVVALAANALIILGAMALNRAAFTMPGIAGVILTFGMALDSNVLIYERIREELKHGADMKTAARLGFSKALSSIVDGNVTNLIVCVVLGYTGTAEIKGFAITMSIGVLSTLFAALIISRLIFDILIVWGKWKTTTMLPMAVPALQRMLTPKIDWLRLRYVFFGMSAVYVALGCFAIFFQGAKMLDNEFRGGTQVTLTFREQSPGVPTKLTRREVEERVFALSENVPDGDQLRLLRGAEVYPLNPEADGVTSDRFVIKTVAQDQKRIVEAVVEKFADVLENKPALSFTDSVADDFRSAPLYRVTSRVLGQDIGRPELRDDVATYLGGAAIVLEGLEPAPRLSSLRDRLEAMRAETEFADTLSRVREVRVLEGTEDAVRTAVVLVSDPSLSLFDNESRWESEVAQREWRLVVESLTRASTPASVQNFSAAIAETFRAQAIVAALLSFILIGIYIWVRFSGVRYSVAAVAALAHDVVTVIGLIALCEILYENPATEGFAQSIGLLPFKIDLNMVAALLTIAGYSLNDTIVIMDRIRENRGKAEHATAEMINAAINQTFSRTLITGGTTMVSCLILYVVGGEGVRAFAFALFTGLVIGTYSSVAIAAPIVWSGRRAKSGASAREAGGVPPALPAS